MGDFNNEPLSYPDIFHIIDNKYILLNNLNHKTSFN